MKKILFMAFAVASLAACSKDDVSVETPAVEGTRMTITATRSADSRTELQPDGLTAVWSKGDKMGVFCTYKAPDGTEPNVNSKQSVFTLQESSAGKTVGAFDGEIGIAAFDETQNGGAGGTYRYYVYYPLNESYTGNQKNVQNTIAPTQTYDATSQTYDLSQNDMLIGRSVGNSRDNTDIAIEFKRVFAMMQFAVTNATGEPFRIQKIEMIAEETKNITGKFKFGISAGNWLDSEGRVILEPGVIAGNNKLTVNVDNGIVQAGGELVVKSIFNRLENLKGTDVTLRVTTSKGVYETVFAGKDYSGSDNWRKTVTVDNLTPVSGESEIDNYVEGSMTLVSAVSDLGSGTNNCNWDKPGVFCIGTDISFANVCQVRCTDLTIMGRYVKNGIPQQKLTSTVTVSKNLPENANVTLKDLVLSPLCDAGKTATFTLLRFNGEVKYALNSLTVDNCIIEIPSTLSTKNDPLIPLCGAGHGIKKIVFKNCVFRNITSDAHAIIGINDGDGDKDIESLAIENCTFYNTNETVLSQSAIVLSTCPDMTIRNNTIYNYVGNTAAPLVKVSSGALVWKDNIVATSAATGAFVFSSLGNVTPSGCVYDNYAEAAGGEPQTNAGLFKAPETGDFTVTSGSVPAGCGDQRWW